MNTDVHKSALAGIPGADNVLSDAGDISCYEAGARYDRGRAAFVLRPSKTSEVSAVVSYCVRHGLHLVPQSGNTGLVSSSGPDSSGGQIVLSLDRMTTIFDVDRDNRSLHLDAGHRLSDINGKLEAFGLQFPIDLGADPRVGGMVATNTGGSRFLKFGDVRRNVLGIKVVLADENGTVLNLMSGLRKNNTGVDWKHLFIGTAGAFGIVTECEINVERIPRQVATALLVPSDGAAIMPLLSAVERRLGTYLSAFEGMSRNAVEAAFAHVPSLRNPFQSAVVPEYVILAEATRDWDRRESERPIDAILEDVLAEIWEQEPGLLADAFPGPAVEMWALRHALSEGVRHRGRLVAFDLSFRRQDVITFCDWMKEMLPQRFEGVSICDFGHIGDGGVHFNVFFETARYDAQVEAGLRAWVYEVAVERFNGSFSAEHGVGPKNQVTYDRYTDVKHRALADGFKAISSPAPLGRVSFGIGPNN